MKEGIAMTKEHECCGGGCQHDHLHDEKECQCHHAEEALHTHDCCGGHHHHHHSEGGCGCGHHHHHHSDEGCGCGHHHGEYDVDPGLTVQFSGVFEASIEEVWEMLTDNQKVQQWFPELEFEALEPGSTLNFNYQDGGGKEEMMLLDVEAPRYLSFTWDINIITFELSEQEENKTQLIFTEWLSEVNNHSPKDLTGWMICLQAIAAILEGKEVGDREEKFHEFYPRVKEMFKQQTDMEFED